MPRIRPFCALLLLSCWLAPGVAAADPPVSRDALAAYGTSALHAWARVTDERGAVRDALEPARGRFNYGTLMLAQAQLRAAARTGDRRLGEAAVDQVLGTIERDGPQDPFYLLGAGTMMREGQLGAYRSTDWQRIAGPLAGWLGRFEAYTGHDFPNPSHYSNWNLVWAVGATALADAAVPARSPTAIAADPAALHAEATRVVSRLAVRSAGRQAERNRRRTMRALSDRVLFPNAYHMLSVYMLERLHASHPELFSRRALRLREEAGRYALTLMAPDGQLTHAGRSQEQSWVLAAAAAYGARRAGQPGRKAAAYAALAQRAADRLLRVHGQLPDGTIPVVPGLRTAWDRTIMDSYASMTQYNGLTLMLLEDAVEHWPATAAAGALPVDRRLLVSDLHASGLAWGAAGNLWWAVGGRTTRGDPRYEQGVVSVKARMDSGWQDLLAARPITGIPRTRWLLSTRRGIARLRLVRARGNGRKARLSGAWWWIDSGRRHRAASVEVHVRGRRLTLLTRLRRGEALTAPLWTAGEFDLLEPTGAATPAGPCLTTASGAACPVSVHWRGRGLKRLVLAAPEASHARLALGTG
jgi:hypothetical protein